jgi:hypothetical protein
MPGKRILLAAVVAYLLAWLLPSLVVTIGGPFGPTTAVIRGWEATRWALSPLWPGDPSITPGWRTLLIAASGLTNLLLVVAVVFAARWPQRITRGLAAAFWAAALLNTLWFLSAGLDRGQLRIGYYLWVSSFVLMAVALGEIRRARPRGTTPAPAT